MRFCRTAFVISSIVAAAALSMQAAPSADTSDIFVAPMLGANWGQGSPMNDLTPRRSPCGCAATAGGQELRLWRWPYRFEKSRTFAHQYLDDDGKWTTYTIRLDGRVPLDWDKIAASGGASTPVASDKETAYNTAMLTAWLQSFAKISFKPGAGSANQKICSEAENWWYEAGPVMSRHRNGYDNLWTAITNDLAFGSPVQINTPVHQMVIDGYAVDNVGTANEIRWINTNYGWGGGICWENFDTATTSGGSAGVFADFQTGYRPQKRVQFEPVPRVSAADVPLVWHLAPCYTNKIDGFTLEIAKFAGATQFDDDFSNSTGVASGEKFKVENGVLGGYPAIQTSYFTYPETYMATTGSVLEFDVQSRYMSGHAATAEICADGGAWETAATIPLSAGKNAAFGTPTHQTVSLAAFAGRTVRLRFKLACTWAGYAAGSSPDFIIDNVSLSGITGFAETETVSIPRNDATPGIYGYTASGLESGANYAFTVTPVMADGSAARSNAATTRIGTPEPAPEVLGVSSVACGLELVQDGFFIECARGIVNDIDVACNASTVSFAALPSHLSILPDEKISVEEENGVFTVHVDATEMAETGKFHDGDMLILTLVATNADGTEAAKNLMLRFNSMRQVMDGTFDVVDSDAATPVWFCGNTTIDAKGQTVVFAAGAFQGTGNVTLTDSTGGGSFAFESLDGFTGTLAFGENAAVSLPADMTAFAGKISSDVTLESGETMKIAGMTPFAGGITLAGGTLKIALSDEDVAYGFSTSGISYITGSVVFVAPDGTETAATQEGSPFSIAGTANVWTGTDAIFGEKYSTQSAWSAKMLPAEGDYVVFNDASTDGYGALMALNLASAVNLAYVKITGNSYFEIDTFTSDTTAKLSADVLENDIYTKLDKNDFTPKVVVPKAKLLIANGMNLACDIDYTLAQNLKTRNYTANGEYNAIQYDHAWNGTVVFENYTAKGLNPGEYGNAQSTVRFKGVTGWLTAGKEFYPAVELVDNGDTPALHWNDGSSSTMATFDALKGAGTFKTSKSSVTDKVLIKDVSAFAGSFNLAAKAVAIADSMPTENLAYTGRLLVNKAATIASGATWKANGGVHLGACELTVAGTLASPLTASAEGAKLTLADGGTIVASQAIAGDYSPSLDFKAGTYKIDADVRETNAVNFCAAEGDVTTLDANGHKMTLASSFFSGSGDITLVSSVAGGSFVIEGVSQDFTGTIRLDGEVNVSLPDDLSSIGGTIAISGASLSCSSAKLGPLSVGVGSTLTVSLTDSEAMKGFSASSVTLDGGTIEFVDQYGTTVGSSTESTTYVKPDGYTLAPVPTAVWVSGEFEDEDSLHGGYKITLNDNTVNDSGNIVIGSATTLGAVIDIAAVTNCAKVTILAKIKTPAGGAPSANSVVAGVLATDNHPIGAACKTAGETNIQGYWLNGANANYNNDGYKFGGSMQTLSEGEAYILFAFQSDPSSISPTTGTALYFGESFGEMSGGNVSGLQWRGYTNSCVSVGGPANSVASMNTVPWAGLEIEAVALFVDNWLAPGDVALYEFPEAKAVVPSWAVASITSVSGETTYYRSVVDALFAIVHGDVDADTVKVLDGSSVDYSSAGFAYDSETQTYTKIKIAIAKIDNGIILLEYTTLAEACEEADLQNIGVVELLAARDSISEAIPAGWSYVSPEDSGTEYGTILKTISEIPGTVSNIAITQENVSLSIDGEWAEVSAKPIYLTLPNSVNDFTISFDTDIPENTYGTLVSWDSGTHDIRIVVTNDVEKMALWRDGSSGELTAVKDDNAILIPSGERYIEVIYYRGSGTTIKVDGAQYYTSGSLRFGSNMMTKLALGGSAKGNPDDVLVGLKVKNFRWGKSPTEPDEEEAGYPVLNYVTRLDGTIYHGNDDNRLVITNWQTQLIHPATRPVPAGKTDAEFDTIDVLFVYDTPGKASVEAGDTEEWNGFSKLEVFSAKATARMNQILCTTDMDTNFWFRMVGVHCVDGTGGTIAEILGKGEGLRDEYSGLLDLRDRYGADVIVTPTTQSGGYGGLARLNTLDEITSRHQNAAYHIASVLLGYSQTHAWVHEIGHNMSLNHYPPANFDPANTWRGLGIQHKIAVDGTSMSTVMAEQGYADFCGGFSSKNHIYHGSMLSLSNHLDSTGVLLEAAPYVSEWRSTRVPETRSVKCLPDNGSTLVGDTEFTLSYPDPDAEIYYQAWGLNDNEFVKYNGPFTIPATTGYAYITAYAVTNGVATAQELVNYSTFGDTYKDVLGSGSLPWSIVSSIDGNWAPSNGGYYEINDNFTGKSNSVCVLSTSLNGPDTLTFEHSELLKDNPYWHDTYPHSYPNSSFVVWVDNEPAYALRDATNTIGSWVSTDIAIPEGTHKVEFVYTHRSGYVSGETVRIKSVALASAAAQECQATVVRVHPRLTRGLAREALLGIRFDNALGGNASAFDVKFRLVNCTKADITDIKYWRQPYTHNYGFYEAEATQGPAATVSAADDATEFTAFFPAGSVWFYPQVGTREDSDYLWVTATINPEISPDAEIWVSVPTATITLSNGGVFDVVNGAETQPHRVFPFIHQIGAYLRQDGTALTDTWAGKLEDSPANRVGNLTDIVVCNDFLVAYDSENDTFKTTWDARGRNNTAQVARIKALRDQYNPKCMIRASLTKGEGTITVDGVTGRPIACAAASAARRKQLIDSILAVMESAGLDGLDIDWEYPGDHAVTAENTQRDWHSYGLLMRDLAAAFFDKGYVLSFCSNLGYQMAPSGYYAAFHAADFVNAMAYGNTTLNASPQVMMTGINVCTSRGVPSRRIVVGQAMYAYEVQNPGWGSVVGWLKEAWPNDNTRWWDADLVWTNRTATKADGTVLSTDKETFEGPASYHAKCNWCRANGYGGVMSWGYYTDVSWDDADLMSLARHQAKSCWPRENWSWPTPPQDSDGAYLLDSEEDWFWLRDNPGVNARFAADIALTHDPLPIETFSGTIDGAGHALSISNDVWLAYDSNPALIRTLTGTVKNLTIDLYGRVVSRASRWNDTTADTSANTLASGTHNAAVLAANLGAGGVIDGVELFIRPGAEVQGPQRVAGLAASVWVADGSHAEIRNSSVHVEGVVRSLARNTAEGDITVQNQVAGGLAGWVACPGSRNIVVTNNIVSLASTGRVAVETGSSSSAGGVIGGLNNVNPLVQNNAVYVASGATVSANESAVAGNVRTSYANASYSIASSANAGQTTFFIEDGAATLAGSVGGTDEATVEISSYGGEATDGISVDAVAGFWYSVIYGDRLVSGGIGGETGETEPVKAPSTGPLTLAAPKEGATRFYRIKVVPVPAAP
ncbi:MAG: hypothetical protein E7049_07700, partial [Lentisphaerae bacterium]|nr:hypothetical protein [Lentisphaerota bacterium]